MSAPFSRSSLATLSCPLPAAYIRGVRPKKSLDSTSAPFSSSILTIASCPWQAATLNGVRPR
ncbi:hypothetical protein BDV24DRAFT_133778 [Aspergillus arachidicola]|uniref:Uncharacterized protein n=1 Tax=Aspergillus arachidicola TaxID=656916 RepID=A0A5N6Y4I9_9EURO|nr:hypothetical protein BDV24DRAFT_133778 [Aspergillus arachidicola]